MSYKNLLDIINPIKRNTSNRNWSHSVHASHQPGAVYPVFHSTVLPGQRMKIDIKNMAKTMATKAPLLQGYKMQYDYFFIPYSAYIPELRQNQPVESLQNIEFPTIPVSTNKIGESSIFEYLYQGIQKVNISELSETVQTNYVQEFNAIPFIFYYDICFNHFSNLQLPVSLVRMPFEMQNSVQPYSYINNNDIFEALNQFKNAYGSDRINIQRNICIILKSSVANVADSLFSTNPTYSNLLGLFYRQLQPDRNTVFLSRANNQKYNYVQTGNTIDTFVTNSKIYNYLMQWVGTSGRYREFIRKTFAVTPDCKSHIPAHLGSTSSFIGFDSITQTVASTKQGADYTIGDQAGRGFGSLNSNNQYFDFNDYGHFMITFSIVPDVCYFQGVDDFALVTKFGDLYHPAFDNVQMQPLPARQLYFNRSKDTGLPVDNNMAIGYQPAWTEYTSKLNKTHGSLSTSLRFWTLSRDCYQKDLLTPQGSVNPYTFVYPEEFQYTFADNHTLAENFILNHQFNIFTKMPMAYNQTPMI